MIRFSCQNCGQKFRMGEDRAGKKGKCPKCKNAIVVPDSQMVADLLVPDSAADGEQGSEKAPLRLTFLDVPQKSGPVAESGELCDESDAVYPYAEAPLPGWRRPEPEPIAERTLPWVIDIFLYPTSRVALVLLGLVMTVPIVVRILLKASGGFILITVVPGWVIVISLYVYTFWYFSASIRQSAEGQLRAPSAVMDTPGVAEMLWELFRALFCLFIFFLPMIFYFGRTQATDTIFWVLFGLGMLLFPMGLLAMTVLDTFSCLNPILLIRSIFNTVVPYCFLVAIYFGLGYLLSVLGPMWEESRENAYVCIAGFTYLLLVAGHLLGRFYFRYQDKLSWDG